MKTPVRTMPQSETAKIAIEISQLAEEISSEKRELIFRFEEEAARYAVEKTARKNRILRFLIRSGLIKTPEKLSL